MRDLCTVKGGTNQALGGGVAFLWIWVQIRRTCSEWLLLFDDHSWYRDNYDCFMLNNITLIVFDKKYLHLRSRRRKIRIRCWGGPRLDEWDLSGIKASRSTDPRMSSPYTYPHTAERYNSPHQSKRWECLKKPNRFYNRHRETEPRSDSPKPTKR